VTDDRNDGIDRKGMRRKFQAIRADQVRLRQQIKEMAAAFADDPAERQDYRHTLIYLLVADAVQPLWSKDDRIQVDALMSKLSKALHATMAQRNEIHRLLIDLGLAIDDAFEM